MDTVLIFWRVVLLVVNVGSIVLLFNRLRKYRKTWQPGTRDYWWTLLLWSFTGAEIAGQGLIEHTPMSARLIFVSIASLAAPIGLRRKQSERERATHHQ